MKRVLSCLVSALVALSFAGWAAAANYPAGGSTPSDSQRPANMKSGTGTSSKEMKKDKKKKKKAKKTYTGSGMGAGGGTSPHYGTAPEGGPSNDGMGDFTPGK